MGETVVVLHWLAPPPPDIHPARHSRVVSVCVLMEAGRQAHRAESQASRSSEAAPSRAAHQYGPKIRASMCSALSAANRWRGTCPAQTLRHPTGPQKKGTNSELISVTLFLRCRVLCEYFFPSLCYQLSLSYRVPSATVMDFSSLLLLCFSL